MRPQRFPRQTEQGGLYPELIDLLLVGWGGDWRATAAAGERTDAFRIFTATDADLAAAWRRY